MSSMGSPATTFSRRSLTSQELGSHHRPPGPAPDAPLSSEDGTRTGRPGAATLDCVDDLKTRAASADQDRRARLNQRLRQAFIAGAEGDSRRRLGRGLTAEELERVLRRYAGDLAERPVRPTHEYRCPVAPHSAMTSFPSAR